MYHLEQFLFKKSINSIIKYPISIPSIWKIISREKKINTIVRPIYSELCSKSKISKIIFGLDVGVSDNSKLYVIM